MFSLKRSGSSITKTSKKSDKSDRPPSLTESAIRAVASEEGWEDVDPRNDVRSKVTSRSSRSEKEKKKSRKAHSRSTSRERSRKDKEYRHRDSRQSDVVRDSRTTDDRTSRSDRTRALDDTEGKDRTRAGPSAVPNQFPGQFPTDFAPNAFGRAGKTVAEGGHGLAADYYGDQWQSVSSQPGYRPTSQQPTSAPPMGGAASEYYAPTNSSFGQTAVPSSVMSESTSFHTAAGISQSQLGGAQPSGPSNVFYAPPPQQSSSNFPGLAAAGVAAGAYAAHLHHSNSHSAADVNPAHGGPTNGVPSLASTLPGSRHKHAGPVDKLLDIVQSKEDIRKMEEYTEYIGVCKYCFGPRSSSRDAARHYYHGRAGDGLRRRSSDSLRQSARRKGRHAGIHKDSRYHSASSDSDSRRKNRASWLGAGLAGYGLAKLGGALWNSKNDFDDTYSVQTGRSDRPPSYRTYATSVEHGVTRSQIPQDGSSKRHPVDTFSKVAVPQHRRGSRSRDRGDASRVSPRASAPRTERHQKARSRSQSPTLRSILGFSKSKRRDSHSRKQKGFFNFGNASSSSSSSEGAFGKRSSKRRPSPNRKSRGSDDHLQTTLLGIGATAAALAAAQGGRRPELVAVREKRGGQKTRARPHHQDPADEEGWESASDSESSAASALAFGYDHSKRARRSASKDSLSSQGSGTSKWGWRWGGSSKKAERPAASPIQPFSSYSMMATGTPPTSTPAQPTPTRPADVPAALSNGGSLSYIDPMPVEDTPTSSQIRERMTSRPTDEGDHTTNNTFFRDDHNLPTSSQNYPTSHTFRNAALTGGLATVAAGAIAADRARTRKEDSNVRFDLPEDDPRAVEIDDRSRRGRYDAENQRQRRSREDSERVLEERPPSNQFQPPIAPSHDAAETFSHNVLDGTPTSYHAPDSQNVVPPAAFYQTTTTANDGSAEPPVTYYTQTFVPSRRRADDSDSESEPESRANSPPASDRSDDDLARQAAVARSAAEMIVADMTDRYNAPQVSQAEFFIPKELEQKSDTEAEDEEARKAAIKAWVPNADVFIDYTMHAKQFREAGERAPIPLSEGVPHLGLIVPTPTVSRAPSILEDLSPAGAKSSAVDNFIDSTEVGQEKSVTRDGTQAISHDSGDVPPGETPSDDGPESKESSEMPRVAPDGVSAGRRSDDRFAFSDLPNASAPFADRSGALDSEIVEEIVREGVDSDEVPPMFYRAPFFETVSDLGGVLDPPGYETVAQHHGFVEGEVDEPTPLEGTRTFMSDFSRMNNRSPPSPEVRYATKPTSNDFKAISEQDVDEVLRADETFPDAPGVEVSEDPWEASLSKKEKKKREKMARKVSDNIQDTPVAHQIEEEWQPPLSKKEQKKRDKLAKQKMDVDPDESKTETSTSRAIDPEPEDAWEPPLSKKEQKKRDKLARKQMDLDADEAEAETSGSRNIDPEPEDVWEAPLSKKELKKRAKQMSAQKEIETPPVEVEQEEFWSKPLSKKDKKKLEKQKLRDSFMAKNDSDTRSSKDRETSDSEGKLRRNEDDIPAVLSGAAAGVLANEMLKKKRGNGYDIPGSFEESQNDDSQDQSFLATRIENEGLRSLSANSPPSAHMSESETIPPPQTVHHDTLQDTTQRPNDLQHEAQESQVPATRSPVLQTPKRPQPLPLRPTSSTAVPIRFRKPPQSPGLGSSPTMSRDRAASFSTFVPASPDSPAGQTPRSLRAARPRSTEVRREFQPLYLVEHNRKASEAVFEEEQLPPLPPSEGTSRTSSLRGSEGYQSAVEDQLAMETGSLPRIRTDLHYDSHNEDVLSSNQTTPKATHFPSDALGIRQRPEPEFYSWEDVLREEKLRSEHARDTDQTTDSGPTSVFVTPLEEPDNQLEGATTYLDNKSHQMQFHDSQDQQTRTSSTFDVPVDKPELKDKKLDQWSQALSLAQASSIDQRSIDSDLQTSHDTFGRAEAAIAAYERDDEDNVEQSVQVAPLPDGAIVQGQNTAEVQADDEWAMAPSKSGKKKKGKKSKGVRLDLWSEDPISEPTMLSTDPVVPSPAEDFAPQPVSIANTESVSGQETPFAIDKDKLKTNLEVADIPQYQPGVEPVVPLEPPAKALSKAEKRKAKKGKKFVLWAEDPTEDNTLASDQRDDYRAPVEDEAVEDLSVDHHPSDARRAEETRPGGKKDHWNLLAGAVAGAGIVAAAESVHKSTEAEEQLPKITSADPEREANDGTWVAPTAHAAPLWSSEDLARDESQRIHGIEPLYDLEAPAQSIEESSPRPHDTDEMPDPSASQSREVAHETPRSLSRGEHDPTDQLWSTDELLHDESARLTGQAEITTDSGPAATILQTSEALQPMNDAVVETPAEDDIEWGFPVTKKSKKDKKKKKNALVTEEAPAAATVIGLLEEDTKAPATVVDEPQAASETRVEDTVPEPADEFMWTNSKKSKKDKKKSKKSAALVLEPEIVEVAENASPKELRETGEGTTLATEDEPQSLHGADVLIGSSVNPEAEVQPDRENVSPLKVLAVAADHQEVEEQAHPTEVTEHEEAAEEFSWTTTKKSKKDKKKAKKSAAPVSSELDVPQIDDSMKGNMGSVDSGAVNRETQPAQHDTVPETSVDPEQEFSWTTSKSSKKDKKKAKQAAAAALATAGAYGASRDVSSDVGAAPDSVSPTRRDLQTLPDFQEVAPEPDLVASSPRTDLKEYQGDAQDEVDIPRNALEGEESGRRDIEQHREAAPAEDAPTDDIWEELGSKKKDKKAKKAAKAAAAALAAVGTAAFVLHEDEPKAVESRAPLEDQDKESEFERDILPAGTSEVQAFPAREEPIHITEAEQAKGIDKDDLSDSEHRPLERMIMPVDMRDLPQLHTSSEQDENRLLQSSEPPAPLGDWAIDPLLETNTETPDEYWARMKKNKRKGKRSAKASTLNTPIDLQPEPMRDEEIQAPEQASQLQPANPAELPETLSRQAETGVLGDATTIDRPIDVGISRMTDSPSRGFEPGIQRHESSLASSEFGDRGVMGVDHAPVTMPPSELVDDDQEPLLSHRASEEWAAEDRNIRERRNTSRETSSRRLEEDLPSTTVDREPQAQIACSEIKEGFLDPAPNDEPAFLAVKMSKKDKRKAKKAGQQMLDEEDTRIQAASMAMAEDKASADDEAIEQVDVEAPIEGDSGPTPADASVKDRFRWSRPISKFDWADEVEAQEATDVEGPGGQGKVEKADFEAPATNVGEDDETELRPTTTRKMSKKEKRKAKKNGLLAMDYEVIEPDQATAESSGQDIDFAATLAAGLEQSGFDSSIVTNDSRFHRRQSPRALTPEADPEEVAGSGRTRSRDSDHEQRQRSVDQRPSEDRSVHGERHPSAERSSVIDDKPAGHSTRAKDDLDAILAASLGAAGFSAAKMLKHSDEQLNRDLEPDVSPFTTSRGKKKKNKGQSTEDYFGDETAAKAIDAANADAATNDGDEIAASMETEPGVPLSADDPDPPLRDPPQNTAIEEDEWAMPAKKKKGKKGKAKAAQITDTPTTIPETETIDPPLVTSSKKSKRKGKKGKLFDWTAEEPASDQTQAAETAKEEGDARKQPLGMMHTSEISQSLPIAVHRRSSDDKLQRELSQEAPINPSAWSFDALDSNRDSGLPEEEEGPASTDGRAEGEVVRDSGYDTTADASNAYADDSYDLPETIIEDTTAENETDARSVASWEDWELPIDKRRTREAGASERHSRTSPVEPTSKNRTSYLFQTPPAGENSEQRSSVRRAMELQEEHGHTSIMPLDYVPLESPTRKRSKADYDIGTPDHGVKSTRRSETPLQSFRQRMDSTASRPPPLDLSEEQHRQRSNGQSRLQSLRSPTAMSSASASSLNRLRSPDIIHTPTIAASIISNDSATPSLRRSDRSISGDLRHRAAVARGEAVAPTPQLPDTTNNPLFRAPPTPPPNEADEYFGDAARANMAENAYEGYGGGEPIAMSPNRTQSMRRKQSSHIMDLEARVDALVAENQRLQAQSSGRGISDSDAPGASHQSLRESETKLQHKDAEISQIRAMLEPLQHEVRRLTEINSTLSDANRNLVADTNDRYATLQDEFKVADEQRHSTQRELKQLRLQHSQLSNGMESIVREHINAALEDKDTEIVRLRAELDLATSKIRELQAKIQASTSDDFLTVRDEDYFDDACQKLCQQVQMWVLRFSKSSDNRACRLTSDLKDEKLETRLDNCMLDGSDVDNLLVDRIKRRDVFMALFMMLICEYVFTRYLFGMDREQRQKLKTLEKILMEVGPQRAVAQWRATTLTLLSQRPAFETQLKLDHEAVTFEIYNTLAALLPPPRSDESKLQASLSRVVRMAVDLSIEMRTQRADYFMLPPPMPEYDGSGDLIGKTRFDANTMSERSGDYTSNDELQAQNAVVKVVLFPLVMKKGDDAGEGGDEAVICPAQVLVATSKHSKGIVRKKSGVMSLDDDRAASLGTDGRSRLSVVSGAESGYFQPRPH